MDKKIGIWVGAILTLLVLIVGWSVAKGPSQQSEGQTSLSSVLANASPKPVDKVEADHVKGNPEAAVTLVEYGDFQCPFCSHFAPIVKNISEREGLSVEVVYRHFPLTTIHRNALAAARASEAADVQGKFWEMHDILFERQAEWSNSTASRLREQFIDYARELELDTLQFEADFDSESVLRKVAVDIATGNSLSVNSTPTFYLNGEQMVYSDLDDFTSQVFEAAAR